MDATPKNLLRWIVGLAITAAIVALVWYFRSVVIYILVSAVFAIIGRPVVRVITGIKVGRRCVPRWLASLLTLVFMWVVIIGFCSLMIPLVTGLAGLIPSLFSGAMITESVFDLPGIGSYALKAMQQGDIPVIMTYNMFLATLSGLGVLMADLMYGIVDPRVKLA